MNENLQKTAREVIELLRAVQEESPENVLRIFFCEKRGADKYRTYMPQVSNDLQKKIFALVLQPLLTSLELPVVQYNPVGVLDEENELIVPNQVSCVEAFKESLLEDKLITEMSQIKVKNIYILSNKTINLKKPNDLKPLNFNEYDYIIKKNLLDDSSDKNSRNNSDSYRNFIEGLEEPAEEMEPQPYYFHSSLVTDAQMKNNIYLPKIMDRMKYSIPRGEREKNGFLIKGKALFSHKKNHDEHKNNYEII